MKKSLVILVILIVNTFILMSSNDRYYYTWGQNIYSELGLVNSNGFVQIDNENNWVDASINSYIGAAIKKDGTLWKWGVEDLYQEEFKKDISLLPKKLGYTQNWNKVWTFPSGLFALRRDSSLWQYGNIVEKYDSLNNQELRQAGYDFGYIQIFPSFNRVYGLKSDSSLWVWGDNTFGNFGDGTYISSKKPVEVMPKSKWKWVSGNKYFTLGIMSNGTLWVWGSKSPRCVVDSNKKYFEPYPQQLGFDTDWEIISALEPMQSGLKSNGELLIFNWNETYEYNYKLDFEAPLFKLDSNVKFFTATNGLFFILKRDDSLWSLNHVQTVNGKLINKLSEPIFLLDNVRKFSSSKNQVVAIKNDSTLWTGGSNSDLNAGVLTRVIPEPFRTDFYTNDWKKIEIGLRFGAGIKSDSSLWLWGNHFQLDSTDNSAEKYKPIQYKSNSSEDEKWIGVYSSGYVNDSYLIAIRSDSTIWAWFTSSNYKGNLKQMQLINDNKNWLKIITSERLAFLVITTDYMLYEVILKIDKNGYINYSYERIGNDKFYTTACKSPAFIFAIGTNGRLSKLSRRADAPSIELSYKQFKKVTTEIEYMYAIDSADNLWRMYNDGYTLEPIKIGHKWLDIESGSNHTLAIRDDNSLWGSGNNYGMQLGKYQVYNSDTLFLIDDSKLWYKVSAQEYNSYGVAEEIIGGIVEPVLIYPENNSFIDGLDTKFVWKKVKNALGYILELSNDLSFNNIVDTYYTNDTTHNVTSLIDNSTYYWKLTALHQDGFNKKSSIWQFYTKSTSSVSGGYRSIQFNPTSDFITIQTSEVLKTSEVSNVQIFDVLGMEIKGLNPALSESEGVRIDVSDLPAGVYFIRILSSNGACSIVEKFVKM